METFAEKFRPQTFDDVVGNQELVQTLKTLVESHSQISLILSGEPGTGKTTLAEITAKAWNPNHVVKFNAAYDSKSVLRDIVQTSRKHNQDDQQPDIVIIDEVHRLDKAKQDFLLPALEHDNVIMIGTTTENPSLAINPAIRSRTMTFELQPLSLDDIHQRITAIYLQLSQQKQLSDSQATVIKLIIKQSHGDLRTALNLLQVAYQVDQTLLDPQVETLIKHQNTYKFDRNGSHHYQAMAALQKSVRGSDVDAALYYLATVLEAGDVDAVVRRIRVMAYEDIGLANIQLATQVQTMCDTALAVGMPEARIPLADAVILMALSDKLNTGVVAYDEAANDAQQNDQYPIPNWINREHPVDYKYPHNFENHIVKQQYLPDKLVSHHYFGDAINHDVSYTINGEISLDTLIPSTISPLTKRLDSLMTQYDKLNRRIGRDD